MSTGCPQALLFNADTFADYEDIRESFDRTPKYLFRLHAPETVGSSSTLNVTSPAWSCNKAEKKKDLLALKFEEAADLLDKHLNWKCSRSECNLMSWTSSLLFAIQYGLFRYTNDRPKPALSKVLLLIVNTSDFPKGTFLRDLEAIEAFKEYSRSSPGLNGMHSLRKGGKYYFGEYLSQGRLNVDGKCSQTSIQQMIDSGLFDLSPTFKDVPCNKWATAVVDFRTIVKKLSSNTKPSDVRKAITIAQASFGGQWVLPVAAMLLSLEPRQRPDRVIIDGFRAMFSGKLYMIFNTRIPCLQYLSR